MIGQTVLHYKILEELGRGGMGEVYKAQDTKLDRFVALKFLPSQLTASEEDKARFIQEAKAASAMNHPNVCTIYDIQDSSGQLFIVMEYVDGKTLKDKKDSLSEKQILEIGIQVAEGLAAAHEKGIVHRDIKPENIMIRKDGIAQIMDFGLAKLRETSGVSRLTKAGTTMGTMGYMSPEQVQGLDVDHRTDIFSLGVVLYEMLAGESPFKGVHETAIMYEIVNVDPPPIATTKEGFDPQLDDIILECLEKDRDERCQSAKELAKDLRKVKKSTGHSKSRVYKVNSQTYKTQPITQSVSKSSGSITIEAFNKRIELAKIFRSGYFTWSLILILLAAVLYPFLRNQSPNIKPITATSTISSDNININSIYFQISRDGKALAFIGGDSTGNSFVCIRKIDSKNVRELNNTEGAYYPFWSYNGRYVFFFVLGKLKRVGLNSGAVMDICSAEDGRGGTCNKEGEIIFAPASTGGLYSVSENGGTPKEIIKADPSNPQESLRFPFFMPDQKHFLYSVQENYSGGTPEDKVKIASISSDLNKTIMHVSSNAQYSDGYLFFIRQDALMCQAFDPDNLKLSGDIYTISGNNNYFDPRIKGAFSVSTAGNLIYMNKPNNNTELVLLDDKGNIKTSLLKANVLESASFSPDGNMIAYNIYDQDGKNADIWTYDIKRKLSSRLTFNPNYDAAPIWSPDGKYIAYLSERPTGWDIFTRKSDGTGDAERIYHSDSIKFLARIPIDWSSDGRYLSFNQISPKTKMDILLINMENNYKAEDYLATNFNEGNAIFSSDMKWIMYTSGKSGKPQVYVRPFGGGEGRWQVSINGGIGMKWIDNDKGIIYVYKNNIYEVSVNGSGQNFIVGKTHLLFSLSGKKITNVYDVTNDGKTFLAAVSLGRSITPPFTYVQNWKGLIQGGSQ
jgi:serine/threonine protein kinase